MKPLHPLLAGAALLSIATAGADPPNIVLVMVDDMGWTDIGCQGNERVDTPNIDALAARGVRFTDAYAAAPVCSPTRAAVLTGKSPARLHITNHIPDRPSFWPDDAQWQPAEMRDELPLEEVTLAERLHDAGYATAFLGKWHLNGRTKGGDQGRGDERYLPDRQGFDVNIGGCAYGGPPTFWDPYGIFSLPAREPGEYLPDRLADEAIEFVRTNRERPFFVCLWNYAVHWPMEAPEQLVAKYTPLVGPGVKDARYAAMTEALDAALGRIFDELETLELTRQTLVIFTSDNGPYLGVAEPRPLREGKGYLYEGGIRVPLIVSWPGTIEPATSSTPVVSMDFYPTVLEAAGIEQREDEAPDGMSLMPSLLGGAELERSALFFHYPSYAFHKSNRLGGAIRAGRYKLIEYFDDGSVELYDLETDLGEERDLAQDESELARELRQQLTAWRTRSGANMPIAIER